jgi:hypothetical protein
MQLHRVGVGEGTWVPLLGAPLSLNPVDIAEEPFRLSEVEIPIGDYNLMKISLGNLTATIRGRNVTLSAPTQDQKVPAAFTVAEGKRISLVVDLSFNEAAVATAKQFIPYVTVTIEQPGVASLSTIASTKPLASIGPGTLGANESKSSTFTVDPGAAVENYLVHAQGGLGGQNTFNIEILETGEFWYGLAGNLWFLGGNLTSGTYHIIVGTDPWASGRMTFAVNLYSVPRITGDLPDVAFSGLVPAQSFQSIQVNEFALYLDNPGSYDFYLGVKAGDYEFLVDDNPESIVSGDHMLTLQLNSGLHTFQIFADFSGSGRDTSWTVGIVPAPNEAGQPLSREATLSTGLLLVAALVFTVDVGVRQLRRRARDKKAAAIVEMSLNSER